MEEDKYKAALERAKSAIKECGNNLGRIKMIESIFPDELGENKDEKIRKDIRQCIKLCSFVPSNGTSKDEMFTWLEKQGEQNPTLPKWRYKNDNTPLLRDSIILNKYGCVSKSPSGALVRDVWVIDYDELAKLPKEESENQGEQKTISDIRKPADIKIHQGDKNNPYDMSFEEAQDYIAKRDFDICWNDCDVYVDDRYITQTIGNVLRWADDNPKLLPVEETKEEKADNTDKVETKFKVGDKVLWKYDKSIVRTISKISKNGKYWIECYGCGSGLWDESELEPYIEHKFNVGDWIINDQGSAFLITYIDGENKRYVFGIGGYTKEQMNYEKIEFADTHYRLWSIADAKDGDVVVDKSDGTIGIFESIGHHPDGGSYNDPSYCFLHCRYDDHFFYADFEGGNTIDADDLIPATKEQRELLFTKMKEAGYKWDDEKKELTHKEVTKKSDKDGKKWIDEKVY